MSLKKQLQSLRNTAFRKMVIVYAFALLTWELVGVLPLFVSDKFAPLRNGGISALVVWLPWCFILTFMISIMINIIKRAPISEMNEAVSAWAGVWIGMMALREQMVGVWIHMTNTRPYMKWPAAGPVAVFLAPRLLPFLLFLLIQFPIYILIYPQVRQTRLRFLICISNLLAGSLSFLLAQGVFDWINLMKFH